jgi:hypothetical protein
MYLGHDESCVLNMAKKADCTIAEAGFGAPDAVLYQAGKSRRIKIKVSLLISVHSLSEAIPPINSLLLY